MGALPLITLGVVQNKNRRSFIQGACKKHHAHWDISIGSSSPTDEQPMGDNKIIKYFRESQMGQSLIDFENDFFSAEPPPLPPDH